MFVITGFDRLWRLSSAALLVCVVLSVGSAAAAEAPQPSDLRTPPSGPAPKINGPKIYGAKPGRPFLYRIPSTGERPMRFTVRNLPATLAIDAESGIISGTTPAAGRYTLTLSAANSHGKATRAFTLVSGDTLSLTPPMGWNHWYVFSSDVTDGDIRRAALAMVTSGMADHGYQFVSIDDGWARKPGSNDPHIGGQTRDANGDILPNDRFPDMRALTGYIHSLGLKAGIYTSPGALTCERFEGSYEHEEQDARQFSQWGFDLLKYDYCSYYSSAMDKRIAELEELSTLAEHQHPYRIMGSLLESADRDIILNMCQYGMREVWKWGRQVGGHSWRTTGDLGMVRGDALPAFYHIGLANAELSAHARPGGWNDPDYILIGTIGSRYRSSASAHRDGLAPGEQYSYMSMWSLMAAPLFFSGDMTQLDALTLNVLNNSEVIDINQDSLGEQARIVRKTSQEVVLAKRLDDGSVAVGLFNLGEAPLTISVAWGELGINGAQRVRDVWRQRDVGTAREAYSSSVNAHDVMLVRFIPGS